MKTALGQKVKDVRLTRRLTDSPACVVVDDHEMSGHLQRLLQASGQEAPRTPPILELNPEHSILKKLENYTDSQTVASWATILLDQALLAEGEQLEDPISFVRALNTLLTS